MNVFIDWLPWVAIALIPGGCNVIVAYQELADRCRFMPFFAPYKSLGVWFWAIVQLSIPTILFWILFKIDTKPNIDRDLFIKAFLFGSGFSALVNTGITLWKQTFSIKSIFGLMNRLAFNLIRSHRVKQTTQFWDDLENSLINALKHNRLYLKAGRRALEHYFMGEINFSEELREVRDKRLKEIQESIDKITSETNSQKNAEMIRRLLQKVERKQLVSLLQAFHCDEALLKKYFPRQLAKRKSQ